MALSRKDRRLALALANKLIEGVGDVAVHAREDLSDRVIHLRRPLSTEEEKRLPAELVPVDEAGGAGYLDSIAKVVALGRKG